MPDRHGPEEERMAEQRLEADEDATAQDVIDALRLALMSQDDPTRAAALTRSLLELAPETNGNRGIDLLLHLIAEGSMTVEAKGA